MKSQLRQEIEAGLREGRSLLSLRLILEKFAKHGGECDEARLVLQELRAGSTSEEIEDRILELLDIVDGFIRAELRIW